MTFWSKVLSQDEMEKIHNSGEAYNYLEFPDYSSHLKAWWRFGDYRSWTGDQYAQVDQFTQNALVRDRSGRSNDLLVWDQGIGYPNIISVDDSFHKKSIKKTNYVEAIVFPSASSDFLTVP